MPSWIGSWWNLIADGRGDADGVCGIGVRDVVCVGLLVDETGRKMSKHLGNVLEPIPLMDRHGADALRWCFKAWGSPWGARRVGHDVLSEIVRKVLLTYWNTASFLVLYANAGGWSPSDGVSVC